MPKILMGSAYTKSSTLHILYILMDAQLNLQSAFHETICNNVFTLINEIIEYQDPNEKLF